MNTPYREVNHGLSGTQVAREVGLSEAPERHKYSCPSCQSTDAMQAYPALGGGGHCFSCWTNFTAVDLAAAAWGLIPADACARLAERFGIEAGPRYRNSRRPARQTPSPRPPEASCDPNVRRIRAEVYGETVANLVLGPRGRTYLETRGVNSDFASVQGLRSIDGPTQWTELYEHLGSIHSMEALGAAGFARDGNAWMPWGGRVPAILIPYFSRTDQIEAIRFRRMTPGDRRYMAPIGAGARIPWRAEAFDGPRPLDLVITEGELDALSLLEAGYESVALGGATPSGVMLEWLVDAVEHANTIALWTDADPAGEGAVDRLARLLTKQYGWAWVESHVVRWRSATDANDMAASGELQ